jgi:hypothetical protein
MSLGIIVSSMGKNQLAYHISRAKADDFVVFYENLAKPWCILPFSIMNVSEAYDFRGPVVATTLIAAERLLKFPGPTRRYLYVWDLEWIRETGMTYEELSAVYNNKKIELIVRNQCYFDIVEDCWNRTPVGIVDYCDVGELMKVVGNEQQE